MLKQLLEFNPLKRISSEDALHHNWTKMFDEKEMNQEAINNCLLAL